MLIKRAHTPHAHIPSIHIVCVCLPMWKECLFVWTTKTWSDEFVFFLFFFVLSLCLFPHSHIHTRMRCVCVLWCDVGLIIAFSAIPFYTIFRFESEEKIQKICKRRDNRKVLCEVTFFASVCHTSFICSHHFTHIHSLSVFLSQILMHHFPLRRDSRTNVRLLRRHKSGREDGERQKMNELHEDIGTWTMTATSHLSFFTREKHLSQDSFLCTLVYKRPCTSYFILLSLTQFIFKVWTTFDFLLLFSRSFILSQDVEISIQWTNSLHRPFWHLCVYVLKFAFWAIPSPHHSLPISIYIEFGVRVFFHLCFIFFGISCFLFSTNFQLLLGYLWWGERYWWWNAWGQMGGGWGSRKCRLVYITMWGGHFFVFVLK